MIVSTIFSNSVTTISVVSNITMVFKLVKLVRLVVIFKYANVNIIIVNIKFNLFPLVTNVYLKNSDITNRYNIGNALPIIPLNVLLYGEYK